ncbi:MAG TPA: hypothetical protein VGN16_21255 [Acidobacteriaceae bacterium]
MTPLHEDAVRIFDFLREIGLSVRVTEIEETTFLPGLHLEPNGLVVDPDKLLYPGDLLHEAGHLAVMTAEERERSGSNAGEDQGMEIGAQCWSYAAAVHIGLAPEVVFHEHGYRNSSQILIANYRSGTVGVPLLQWMGLTLDAKRAAEQGAQPYPHMQHWLRVQGPPAEE